MVFHRFLLNYTEFLHETSHIMPSKYDSTSGTNISVSLKISGGWGCGLEQAPLLNKEQWLTQYNNIATWLVVSSQECAHFY